MVRTLSSGTSRWWKTRQGKVTDNRRCPLTVLVRILYFHVYHNYSPAHWFRVKLGGGTQVLWDAQLCYKQKHTHICVCVLWGAKCPFVRFDPGNKGHVNVQTMIQTVKRIKLQPLNQLTSEYVAGSEWKSWNSFILQQIQQTVLQAWLLHKHCMQRYSRTYTLTFIAREMQGRWGWGHARSNLIDCATRDYRGQRSVRWQLATPALKK